MPTRELAVQVDEELKKLAQFTPIRTLAVFGGQKITVQMKFLERGPEVLVGTPGRVIDLLDRRIIDFGNVRFVVLDEVDRMLDIGFRDDIRNILSRVKGVRRRMPDDVKPAEPTATAEGGQPPAQPVDDGAAPDDFRVGHDQRRDRQAGPAIHA